MTAEPRRNPIETSASDRPPFPIVEFHAHIAPFGEALTQHSLEGCRSLAECLDRVAEWADQARVESRQTGTPPFVRARGVRVMGWPEARWPTLEELDNATRPIGAASSDTGGGGGYEGKWGEGGACVLMSFDHHAAVANSAALHAAGLKPNQRVGEAGLVEADPSTGRATGLLHEQAAYAAWDAAPALSDTQRKQAVAAALDRFAELGFVEVHDLHTQPWLAGVLVELEREGRLPVDVRLFPPIDRLADEMAHADRLSGSRVQIAGGKLFLDGTLNNRTALMLHEYATTSGGHPSGSPAKGVAMHSQDRLDDAYREADRFGLPLSVHAIGDGAVRMALDSIERVRPRTGFQRIEHAELIDEDDVPRFAGLGVVCSVQPCHLLTDIEVLRRHLPHRLGRVLPLRELIGAGVEPGVLLRFGSDAPIVRPEPEDSIIAATLRRRPGDPASSAIAPEQSIDERAAWACFARR